ncbi:MAG: ABC transporter substrate-binding protein [Anaerolineae bacterium]|nr:ABC transporter substrate-binding protein [Anaerolineae bacterium]
MMLRRSFARFLPVLLTLAMLTGAALRAQDAPRSITFFLTFIPNIQFSPVYVAIEKGYFAEAGLDITLEHGDEPDGVNLIAAGERLFGMISGEQVITARANSRPVRFVYEWFQAYPVGVVVSGDGTIKSAADLRGHKIGIPGPFGASYSGLIALLTANGLTEQDIQLESIGFNAPQVFCAGAVEASVIYVNNEPIQIGNLAARGECGDVHGVSVLNVADFADMVSNGIITNEDTIASEPELVAQVVEAFHRGLSDVIANPAEAYLLSLGYVESLPRSEALIDALESAAAAQSGALEGGTAEENAAARGALLTDLRTRFDAADLLQLEILSSSIDLWEAPRLGYSDPESWQVTQDTLIQMGVIDVPIDLSAAYTNDFVPGEAESSS